MVSQPNAEPGFTGNRFLDSLSASTAARLLPQVERVEGPVGMVIAHPSSAIDHVYFPVSGVISSVLRMQDGTDVEVALVGREGFYGVPVALGNEISAIESMVQIADPLWRMRSRDFVTCLRADGALHDRVLRYSLVTLETVSQFSACNRLHPINERCARWLLMAHDRVASNTINLTHEYLATMLGVRRPGVSLAAAALDQAGLITYHRGRIVVKDRTGLEAAACECYDVANGALERIMGYGIRRRLIVEGEPMGPTIASLAN